MAQECNYHHGDVVINHVLSPRWMSRLDDLALRDYPNKNYFAGTDIPALDLDSYETDRTGKGNNDCTVDAAIGICNEQQGAPVHPRLMLVELRNGYKAVEKVKPDEVKRKETHSRDLLREADCNVRVDEIVGLVFDENLENQLLNRTRRLKLSGCFPAHWHSFTSITLCNYINYGCPMPYTPKAMTEEMAKRFEESIAAGSIYTCDDVFDRVKDYYAKCRLQYLNGECRWLANRLIQQENALMQMPVPTDFERSVRDIIVDDLKRWVRMYQ